MDRGEAGVDIGFRGVTIYHVPSRAVDNYFIILNANKASKLCRSSEYLSLYFVLRIFKRSYDASQKIYGEPYAHKFYAVDIFLEYHPSSSNITRCQVPSRVRAWFHDSAGDIDFYQMSLYP